jgi:hypothetical protein
MRLQTNLGWQEPYEMDSDVVIAQGPVDRGKTSLLDAIAFAFGRDVRFRGGLHFQSQTESAGRDQGVYSTTREVVSRLRMSPRRC